MLGDRAVLFVDGRYTVQAEQQLDPDAALRQSNDWASGALPICDLDKTTRDALHAAWIADARMEHASVAAFNRFSLELLSFGAPPDLVSASNQAALEEVAHAQACFAQAARFSDEPLGPAELELSRAWTPGDLQEAVREAFREGCVGETLAALTAKKQAEQATDLATRQLLDRIANDETRHAELAWRFVAWALQQTKPATLATVLREEFRKALAPSPSTALDYPAHVHRESWTRYGRLSERDKIELRKRTLSDVVRPCLNALLQRENLGQGVSPSNAFASGPGGR